MRAVIAIVLVVGLLLAVAELDAKHPPTRNIAIPIYLGDPDGVEWARPSGRSDEPRDLHRCWDMSWLRLHSQVAIHISHPFFSLFGVRQSKLRAGDQSCVSQRLVVNAVEKKLDE